MALLEDKNAACRIIIAIDLDAFYVAAARKRDPSLIGLPVGIKQKHILATVSYEARERGIQKLGNVRDAMRQCPELILVNGEDLSYFRHVSAQIFKLVQGMVTSGKVEKLGMDELFCDVTDQVTHMQHQDHETRSVVVPQGIVMPADTANYLERKNPIRPADLDADTHRLLLASKLAAQIRERIANDIGLTSSAGIATSKLLAKLVGNVHKPNRQTVFAPLASGSDAFAKAQQFLDPYPVQKLNGFGSAIVKKMCATAVCSLGVAEESFSSKHLTVSLARQIFDLASLRELFGHRHGTRLHNLLHARDDEPVVAAPAFPAQFSIEDTYQGLDFHEAAKQFVILSRNLIRRLERELIVWEDGVTPYYVDDFLLVVQPHDANGDPIHDSEQKTRAAMQVREYQENDRTKNTQIYAGRHLWQRYPQTLRLSIRQGYTNRVSRQTRLPVEVFDLNVSRDKRAQVLAQVCDGLFRAIISVEGDHGIGLNLINVAALDLSMQKPASSISGFFRSSLAVTSPKEEQKQPMHSSLIDMQFLSELPQDIRAEVAAEYGIEINSDTQTDPPQESLHLSQVDQTVSSSPALVCGVCGAIMPSWLQHDHERWPSRGLPPSVLNDAPDGVEWESDTEMSSDMLN